MDSGRHPGQTPDLTATLCAVLRGEAVSLPAGEEGERLVALARRHRIDRLVAHSRNRDVAPFETPDRTALFLDDVSVREVTGVLAALEDVGAQPLVFKGAALAHTHYAESWLRPRLDADILIAQDRLCSALDALRQLGYRRPAFVSGDLVTYQTMFVRMDPAGVEHILDVHWKIANPQVIARVVSHEELVSRSVMVSALGYSMRVPSAVDALLLACLHRAAHHDDAWDLLWLYDIHLIARRLNAEEWRHVVHLAVERYVAALCARGLQLSQACFNTRVPADVLARLAGDASRREPSAVYLRGDLRLVDRLWVDLVALGPWAGARLVWEHVFPPAEYMEQMYGMPSRALLPAFYARRAFKGASKWLSRRRGG